MKYKRFYIPKLARSCVQHLNYDVWLQIDDQLGENAYSIEQIEDMIGLLCMEPKLTENSLRGNNILYLHLFIIRILLFVYILLNFDAPSKLFAV